MAHARKKEPRTGGRSLINLRVTPDDRSLIDRAAASSGKNRSEFMLDAARRAAQEELLDKLLFSVNAETFDILASDLAKPAAPDGSLRRLMQTKAPWER